jgi:hypothetical protein
MFVIQLSVCYKLSFFKNKGYTYSNCSFWLGGVTSLSTVKSDNSVGAYKLTGLPLK